MSLITSKSCAVIGRIFFSAVLLLLWSGCATVQKGGAELITVNDIIRNEAAGKPDAGELIPEGVTDVPSWFPVGEVLQYKLYWGMIAVGDATLSTDWVRSGDRTLLRITAVAKTGPFVRTLYPVDDYVESLVDPATMLPVQYRQILNEGRKHRTDRIVFDHASKRAVWRNDKTDEAHVLLVSDDTRDVLSYIYKMREMPFASKTNMTTRVIVDEKLYELTIKGIKEENIEINGIDGKVPCFVFEPQAKFGEVFKRKGVVYVWCTKDKLRLCAKMTAFLPFADLKAKLVSFSRERSPVVDLATVEIAHDLLSRDGLPVYDADREIDEQVSNQTAGLERERGSTRMD